MESLAWKGDTPDDWKYCFAQTIVYSDAAYVIPANNAFAMSPDHKFSAGLYLPTGPDTGLDSGFPYLGKTYNSGDREEIGDSPGLPIYNGDGATIYHIQAVTYYMCQPVDSLGNPTGGWVPVASLFWSYTVIARWNGTKTPIIYSDAEVSTQTGMSVMQTGQSYSFQTTNSFPQWSTQSSTAMQNWLTGQVIN